MSGCAAIASGDIPKNAHSEHLTMTRILRAGLMRYAIYEVSKHSTCALAGADNVQ
jgi:hypothetical protein